MRSDDCFVETDREKIARLEGELAAERARLAGLRAHAVKEAAEWRGIFGEVRGCENGGTTAWDEVVALIDGAAR